MTTKNRLITAVAFIIITLWGIHEYRHHHGQPSHSPSSEHKHGHAHEDASEPPTHIDASLRKTLDIHTEQAGPAILTHKLNVSGRVVLNQNTTAQVKARFAGVIRSAQKQPGEQVQINDTLATVESNESLQVYPVRSPVAGTVISRNANVGELAGDAPLFVVASLDSLWAELFVFSRDAEKLAAGQKLHIRCLDDPVSTESQITLVLPMADISSQTLIARAEIENHDRHWRPGMQIEADIVLAETPVALAVRNEALQRLGSDTVVFVETAPDSYAPQPVTTGASDTQWTEITHGLQPPQRYVTQGSFILRADAEKSAASHDH